jgi:hypothetical protein
MAKKMHSRFLNIGTGLFIAVKKAQGLKANTNQKVVFTLRICSEKSVKKFYVATSKKVLWSNLTKTQRQCPLFGATK